MRRRHSLERSLLVRALAHAGFGGDPRPGASPYQPLTDRLVHVLSCEPRAEEKVAAMVAATLLTLTSEHQRSGSTSAHRLSQGGKAALSPSSPTRGAAPLPAPTPPGATAMDKVDLSRAHMCKPAQQRCSSARHGPISARAPL